MRRKKILQSDITGERGVNLVQRIVLEMGFLWYSTGGVEAGIDGVIEIRDEVTGEVTNSIIQVQSKATRNDFTAETTESFSYLCTEKDLQYWMEGNAPVILVVSRPEQNEAYWVSIKDYFRDLERRKTRKILFNKRQQRFDVNCKDALISLALPSGAGVYLAPPPIKETLYSNLLRVSAFPERLFVAETSLRSPKAAWAKLNEAREAHPDAERVGGEWLLKYKSVVSFINPEESLLSEVCDTSTLETFQTKDWAYSNDPDRQRDFVRLLNQCLKEKAWKLGMRYSRACECYYVKATHDLSPRKYRYRSAVNETSRTIFRGYGTKQDSNDPRYYRHSAFGGYFVRHDDTWYLEVTPTYYYTWNAFDLDPYYEDKLKGIKQREKNAALRGQIIMWAEYLTQRRDLFSPHYPYLEFDRLITFDADWGIKDDLWLPHEDEETAKDLSASEPLLFDR